MRWAGDSPKCPFRPFLPGTLRGNATRNYVKVVQRIPVKITFDRKPDVLLGLGMSVVPTTTIR
jgi:multidrug resistance efflux pump